MVIHGVSFKQSQSYILLAATINVIFLQTDQQQETQKTSGGKDRLEKESQRQYIHLHNPASTSFLWFVSP